MSENHLRILHSVDFIKHILESGCEKPLDKRTTWHLFVDVRFYTHLIIIIKSFFSGSVQCLCVESGIEFSITA
jgi:hypothetical protein